MDNEGFTAANPVAHCRWRSRLGQPGAHVGAHRETDRQCGRGTQRTMGPVRLISWVAMRAKRFSPTCGQVVGNGETLEDIGVPLISSTITVTACVPLNALPTAQNLWSAGIDLAHRTQKSRR